MSLLSTLGKVGLGISGAGPLFQAGLGLSQLFRARRMRNLRRPTYEIPDEVKTTLNRRQQELNAESTAVKTAREGIEQTAARTAGSVSRGATDASQLLGVLGATQANTNQSIRELAATEEAIRDAREGKLASAESQMAGYKDKEFQINEMEPYQDKARTRSMLAEGGLQNVSGALGGFSDLAGQLYQMERTSPGMLASFFKKNNVSPASLPEFWRAFNR